jgi:hypothetical protein
LNSSKGSIVWYCNCIISIAVGTIEHSQFTGMVLWPNIEEIKEAMPAQYEYIILRQ